MNTTTVLQVRVPVELRTRSEIRAEELGFTSVQEAIRVFLSSFSIGKVRPGIVSDVSLEGEGEFVELSNAARLRYKKTLDDLDRGKNSHDFSNPQQALAWLNK